MATKQHSAPTAAQFVRSEDTTVTLTAFPADRKVAVIKAIQRVSALGWHEARDLTEVQLPTTIDLSAVPAAEDDEEGWSAVTAARVLTSALVMAGATANIGGTPLDLSLPDRQTLEDRVSRIQMEIYRIKSITGAAIGSVRELQHGEGSEAEGCLQIAHRLLADAAEQLDCVVVLAPAEAQEVAHA